MNRGTSLVAHALLPIPIPCSLLLSSASPRFHTASDRAAIIRTPRAGCVLRAIWTASFFTTTEAKMPAKNQRSCDAHAPSHVGQQRGLMIGNERVGTNDFIQITAHDLIQLVKRQIDTVIA